MAALALPSAMAYAELAGAPVSAGLYALLLPVLAYAVFGSAPRVVVGPGGPVALLVATTLAPFAVTAVAEYAALTAMLALLVGVMFFAARLVRLGWIADYLSQAVLVGYIGGVAVVLILGQFDKLLGLSSDEDGAIRATLDIVTSLGDANPATVVVGALSLSSLIVLARVNKRIPGALILVVLSIAASWALDLASSGVAVTGVVPSGLPALTVPAVSQSDLPALALGAVAIFLLAFSDSILTARSFAARHHEGVDANQELLAFGFAQVGAGLSQGMPIAASGSRSAVNEDMEATSQVSGLASTVTIVAILLFLTAPIQFLPSAVLGAVIIFSSAKLIEPAQWRSLARSSRAEVGIASVTAGFVVTIGVMPAIIAAVALSVVDVIRRAARPADAVLGWSSDAGRYVNVSEDPKALVTSGVVVYRIQDRLFFANAHFFKRRLWAAVDGAPKPVRHVILDASFISDIDAAAAGALREVVAGLRDRNIELHIARGAVELRRQLDAEGVTDAIGTSCFHGTVAAAVEWCDAPDRGRHDLSRSPVTNHPGGVITAATDRTKLARSLDRDPPDRDGLEQEGQPMTDTLDEELGPIDYVVVEFPSGEQRFSGAMAEELASLVDAGLIQVLDLLILVKDADGSVEAFEIEDLGDLGALKALEGSLAEMLALEDVEHLAAAMEPGSAAGVLVWENSWAAPFAVAARTSGGQLIATGRIPTQAILAAVQSDTGQGD